jgi:hypothetical protein
MARRLQQSLADYVVIAISPALIMALVGSLVFFLIGVFYEGEYQARLHWVMACFVFAAVLISRISIEEGFERAAPFGAALALVVGLATMRFLDYRGDWVDHFGWIINIGLIALVWWCAHRLTWDCTVIDDAEDASGEGLLQAAGLEPSSDSTDSEAKGTAAPVRSVEGTTSREVPKGYWQRYVENQRRPHAPGVWVVYFSLAALPLFGLGQWFIPESNTAGRVAAFWLLATYVASGLGLLLTTSFLGLRRYLRQRRIEMPTAMTGLWLSTGTTLILALLIVASILPRPSAEYELARLPFTVGSPEQRAAHVAPSSTEGTRDDDDAAAAPADQSDQESPQASGATSDSAQKVANKAGGQGSKSSSKSNERGVQSSKPDAPAEPDSNTEKQGSEPNHNEPRPKNDERPSNFKQSPKYQSETDPSGAPKPQDDSPPPDPSGAKSAASPPSLTSPPQLPDVAGPLSDWVSVIFRWIFYGVLIVVIAVACWRYRAELAAAWREFLASLRGLWDALMGNKRPKRAFAAREMPELPPPGFSSYADPFASGLASQVSTEELVRYSFEAFEAWSAERGCPRQRDRTPHELANEVARQNAFIKNEARLLAELYAHAAYARGRVPEAGRGQLEALWRQMRSHVH